MCKHVLMTHWQLCDDTQNHNAWMTLLKLKIPANKGAIGVKSLFKIVKLTVHMRADVILMMIAYIYDSIFKKCCVAW